MKIWFAILAIAISAPAQSAKVITLSAADAAEAKSLYEQQEAIEHKISDLREKLRDKYTLVQEGDKDAGNTATATSLTNLMGSSLITAGCSLSISGDPAAVKATQECEEKLEAERKKMPKPVYHYYRRGWETGFTFSEDFRFIVPQQPPSYTPSYNSMLNCVVPTNTLTFHPVITTY